MLRVIKILTGLCVSLGMVSAVGRSRPERTFTDTPQVDFNDCQQEASCTRELNPAICTAKGWESQGNNRCEAMVNLRRLACLRELAIQKEEVTCRSVATRKAF